MNQQKTTTGVNFQKIDDIFHCNLTLQDGSVFVVPMREDGYIHATKLCQAAKKRLDKWKDSPETSQVIQFIQRHRQISKNELIQSKRGGFHKNQTGTWVHPDLGIHLAQWCSPIFSNQVSLWVREILVCGKVVLGKEKTSDQLDETLQERFRQAEEQLRIVKEEAAEWKKHSEGIIVSMTDQNKHLQQQYDKLYIEHQAYLRRKRVYKLNNGKCVYIVNAGTEQIPRLKIGKSDNITNRISSFRTINPHCKLKFLIYTQLNSEIELFMKRIYEEQRIEDREFIYGVPLEELQDRIIKFAELSGIEFRIETADELEKFNSHVVTEERALELQQQEQETQQADQVDQNDQLCNDDIEPTKRCGGSTHQSEDDRILPLSSFFKNKNNTDGHARLCKECYLTGVYGDQRKRRKVVVVPPHDTSTHKWCNRCESIKQHDQFYQSTSTKDGLSANCRQCKTDQKRQQKLRQQQQPQEA